MLRDLIASSSLSASSSPETAGGAVVPASSSIIHRSYSVSSFPLSTASPSPHQSKSSSGSPLTVSTTSDGTSCWSSPSEPLAIDSIDITKPRYDQGTFLGRFNHFWDMTDIRNLAATPSRIEECRELVEKVKNKKPGYENISVEEAWNAKKIVGAAYSANGEIFLPLRFSAFLPMNVLTLFFMLHPSQQSGGRALFWQWWNQTYNSGVNFANRGDTGPVDYKALGVSYALAVGVSCGVSALGSRLAAKMGNRLPSSMKLLIPYTAVACAGLANVMMVRSSDIIRGVEVFDEDSGEALGRSRSAGIRAVGLVSLSRVLLPLPLMTLPPIAMRTAYRLGAFKNRKGLEVPFNLAVIAGILLFALPACIALFPQETVMTVDQLEPEFQNRQLENGKILKAVKFDKGL